MTDLRRFWSKVTVGDGCWLWTGATNHAGYGLFHLNGRAMLAHRVSYALADGAMPAVCVLHRCDTPACIRPDHLFLGTRADNNRDRDQKGRTADGNKTGLRVNPIDRAREHNGRAKLCQGSVRQIRAAYAAGTASQRALASRFGVSRTAIRLVLGGKTWN